jgi:pSer/pThr/pTyr-binding forkhead associated (FHA) protein
VLKDLHTQSGIFINDTKVRRDGTVPLQDNDVIRFGRDSEVGDIRLHALLTWAVVLVYIAVRRGRSSACARDALCSRRFAISIISIASRDPV